MGEKPEIYTQPPPPGPGAPPWQRSFRRAALSWFGCGFSPKAPGTVGSLGSIPLAAVIHWGFGAPALVVLALLIFAAGWAITAAHLAEEPGKDPQWIVIDEVAGQWLALAAVPLHPAGYLLAFGLFRLFDITKPWMIGWADRNVKGALGIMLDDLLAGLYAAMAAFALTWVYRALWTSVT